MEGRESNREQNTSELPSLWLLYHISLITVTMSFTCFTLPSHVSVFICIFSAPQTNLSIEVSPSLSPAQTCPPLKHTSSPYTWAPPCVDFRAAMLSRIPLIFLGWGEIVLVLAPSNSILYLIIFKFIWWSLNLYFNSWSQNLTTKIILSEVLGIYP